MNNIYELLLEKSDKSKKSIHYINRYIKFITLCNKDKDYDGYVEKHHILPSSLFPEYKKFNEFCWNRSNLTPREHLIAHWMLAKALNGYMWSALWCMISGFHNGYRNGKINSNLINTRKFQSTRERYSKICSEKMKKYWTKEKRLEKSTSSKGENNNFYGKKHNEEVKNLISEINSGENSYWYGKKRPDHAIAVSKALKGVPKSESHKKAISESHNKVYTCPHCNKTGGRYVLRWHFDNCFMVDTKKNVYKATDTNGNEFLFGYIDHFAETHNISRSVIRHILKNGGGIHVKSTRATVIDEEIYYNSIGWKFEIFRKGLK